MLFIRIANIFITRAAPNKESHRIAEACTTYRGSKMTHDQVSRSPLMPRLSAVHARFFTWFKPA